MSLESFGNTVRQARMLQTYEVDEQHWKNLKNGSLFDGPGWLLEKEQWPEQPNLIATTSVNHECKPIKEQVLFTKDRKLDEWNTVMERNT